MKLKSISRDFAKCFVWEVSEQVICWCQLEFLYSNLFRLAFVLVRLGTSRGEDGWNNIWRSPVPLDRSLCGVRFVCFSVFALYLFFCICFVFAMYLLACICIVFIFLYFDWIFFPASVFSLYFSRCCPTCKSESVLFVHKIARWLDKIQYDTIYCLLAGCLFCATITFLKFVLGRICVACLFSVNSEWCLVCPVVSLPRLAICLRKLLQFSTCSWQII